jgi:hypothetical protein
MDFSMHGRIAALAILMAALPLPVFAQGAGDAIQKIYRQYVLSRDSGDLNQVPDQLDKSLYSNRVDGLITRLRKACAKTEELCGPSFDFFVDGQDYDLKDIKVEQISSGEGSALVRASFKNFGAPRRITFSMIREKGKWVIDGLKSDAVGDSNAYTLEDVLRP